jgi:general secretion pathway protein C
MIIANMQVPLPTHWMPRLAALVLGALLAASVVYWVLHWPRSVAGNRLPVAAASDAPTALDLPALARVLGADAGPVANDLAPDASSRFRLTGVIASGSGQGVALLSIDGKPPKPYRVGNVIEEGLMLQSVETRRVALSSNSSAPVRMRLELPPKQN